MSNAKVRRKLDLIAKHINELDAALKAEYGPKAHLYFEAEGSVHAMAGGEEGRNEGVAIRQSRIIASSNYCRFDCGSW